MSSPILNLLLFALTSALVAALVWPRHGLLWRLRREHRLSGRIMLEDALKHVFHHEDHGDTATLASLAGTLELSRAKALSLVSRMERMDLARVADGRVLLTEEGRRSALQIVRAHRLWERYLADETGVDPVEWHRLAEQREHRITPAQADALEERLGHPRFDPHGDPIPTADGEVPARDVVPLEGLQPGDAGRVVHIEDEPAVVYAQLVALGIYLGMDLRVAARTDARIVFEGDGRKFVLAPMVAANVSVRPALPAEPPRLAETRETLDALAPGESAVVTGISPACRGLERRRLMDLGIVRGTRVTFERHGLTGGLRAYRVRGTVVALREEQAGVVRIEQAREAASNE
jgi:DtxR family Mn-dependent transcriptional regulator